MSDGAFDIEAAFTERSFFDNAGGFVPWGNPLGSAGATAGAPPAPEQPAAEAPDIEAIRAQAFAEGFEEGCRTVDNEVAQDREALAALLEAVPALQPPSTDALAALLAATVERLVHQIVGEVPINPILLVKRAEAAAALIGEETQASRVLVNPADLPLFARSRVPIEIAGDPLVARGALRLEWGRGCIEDGPAVRLERLRASLDKLGAPQ
jgi:flagellar assembly protein FliH